MLIMAATKADIIAQLQKNILHLQGFKRLSTDNAAQIKLGPIDNAFPNGCFPLAAVHEFISEGRESTATTDGFVACLVSALMVSSGACVWISSSPTVFPPALKAFGIEPDKIIFIEIKNAKVALWVIEEALKYDGLAAVVGELQELSFTESRRFQLAVEQSRVTGFIIRDHPRNLNINACVSRWRISPLLSSSENNLPGIGFPRWNIELLKIRNGKPGEWQMEWSHGRFHPVTPFVTLLQQEQKRKTG